MCFCLDAELDMCSQEKIIKTMFPKVANVAKTTQSGERSNVEQTSLFALHVTRFDAIIGHSRPGICRCPLIPDSACEQIIKICTFAYDFGNNRSTFGIGMRVQVHVDAIQKRIPFASAILADIQRQIRLNKANRQKGDSSVITCHVGGTVDDSKQACDFRYQETSARGRVEMVWRRNPMPALWIGKVCGGVVICSKCYQISYRNSRNNKIPSPFETCRNIVDQRGAKRKCPAPDATAAKYCN